LFFAHIDRDPQAVDLDQHTGRLAMVNIFGWFARGLLLAAGFVASWFIASDAPQFGLMQIAVA